VRQKNVFLTFSTQGQVNPCAAPSSPIREHGGRGWHAQTHCSRSFASYYGRAGDRTTGGLSLAATLPSSLATESDPPSDFSLASSA